MSAPPKPWRPTTEQVELKHLGRLGEELAEAGAAVARCIIQGIDECVPASGKPNREWLEDELADVIANIELVGDYYYLDSERMRARVEERKRRLRAWHRGDWDEATR